MELFQSNDNVTFNGSSYTTNVTESIIFEKEVFNGILQTLLINIKSWLILMLVFVLVKRYAWKNAWKDKKEQSKSFICLFYGCHEGNGDHESSKSANLGFRSWLRHITCISEANIVKKCGEDALHYIRFQRYLLVYVIIVTLISCSAVLPVNLNGNNFGNITDFGRTTAANLDRKSALVWVPVILSQLYVWLAVIFVFCFKDKLPSSDDKQIPKNTLMIVGIPSSKECENYIKETNDKVMEYVRRGETEVDVKLTYDVKHLMKLEKERNSAEEALNYCKSEQEKITVGPQYLCYCLRRCLKRCYPEKNAIDHYSDELKRLSREFEEKKVNTLKKCLGVAFVTFKDNKTAESVLTDSHNTCSRVSCLKGGMWMSYAPAHKDIYWENLSSSGCLWWMPVIIINMLMLAALVFITPSIIASELNENVFKYFVEKIDIDFMIDFVPAFLSWISTALLTNMVIFTVKGIGHWKRSTEHHAVMIKTLIFLLLTVLILKSLQIPSVKDLSLKLVHEVDEEEEWKYLFVTGDCAFVVNYVTTVTFIGSAIDLLRVTELIEFLCKLMWSKSSAERATVRGHVLQEFQYGMQYAWFICVFTIIIVYSLSCPLITPFGLVYMFFRHIVDRHNLYFAYKPSHTTPQIHRTATYFVFVAVIFSQLNLFFFIAIENDSDNKVFKLGAVLLAFHFVFAPVANYILKKHETMFLRIVIKRFNDLLERLNVCTNSDDELDQPLLDNIESGNDLNEEPYVAPVLSRSYGVPMSDIPSVTDTSV